MKLLKLYQSMNCPLDRGQLEVKDFLTIHFESYIEDIKLALNSNDDKKFEGVYLSLEKELSVIKDLCNDIIGIFESYDSAKMLDVYTKFESMMNKIEKYLNIKSLSKAQENTIRYNLYRIRLGSEKYDKKGLFHIPMDKRYLMKSYRYSIPGYPCLYISSQKELCWFECGMPKEFSWSEFSTKKTTETEAVNDVKIICFSDRQWDFASRMQIHYSNYQGNQEVISRLDEEIIKYLVVYPLRAACSIKVLNRDAQYIEEYFLPQQLMLWLRNSNGYSGFMYTSSSSNDNAQGWQGHNFVFPAKEIKEKYCERLMGLFDQTEPVLVDKKSKIDDDIKILEEFIENISIQKAIYTITPINKIISICEKF
ncbi:hypothetical protein [Clostridium gasigenes]|nr:hypothetical protein [Clostridium gasigenes]